LCPNEEKKPTLTHEEEWNLNRRMLYFSHQTSSYLDLICTIGFPMEFYYKMTIYMHDLDLK